MSSILKALRKLEEEKARHRQGSPDISRDILSDGFRRKRASAWVLTCGIFLVAMILGLLGYLSVVDTGLENSPYDLVAGMFRSAEETLSSQSPSSAAGNVTELPQPAAEPAGSSTPAVKATPGTSEPPAVSVPKVVASSPPARSVRALAEPRPRSPAAEPLKSPSIPVRPEFKLSGIAFQENPDSRMAILNGLPVMTGTMIGGARVEEILRDRVRLSFRGQRFEVQLGENGPPR